MAVADLNEALGPDYYLIWDELTEAELEVGLRVRRFVDDEVLPVIGAYWERAELPWPLIEKLAALGIVGEGIDGKEITGASAFA